MKNIDEIFDIYTELDWYDSIFNTIEILKNTRAFSEDELVAAAKLLSDLKSASDTHVISNGKMSISLPMIKKYKDEGHFNHLIEISHQTRAQLIFILSPENVVEVKPLLQFWDDLHAIIIYALE